MTNSLLDPLVSNTLDRLHAEAKHDIPRIIRGFWRSMGRALQPADMVDAYIAMSKEQGELLYTLLRMTGAKRMVEFGTSFGISTLYLGAAARDNGGTVITTEIEPSKCEIAWANIKEAGLQDIITVLEGDAMETLAGLEPPVDHLLLDGWNDLYLPLLKLLEPRFSTGASIVTDNAGFRSAKPLMLHFKKNPQKYATQSLKTDKGRTEFTCYLGGIKDNVTAIRQEDYSDPMPG